MHQNRKRLAFLLAVVLTVCTHLSVFAEEMVQEMPAGEESPVSEAETAGTEDVTEWRETDCGEEAPGFQAYAEAEPSGEQQLKGSVTLSLSGNLLDEISAEEDGTLSENGLRDMILRAVGVSHGGKQYRLLFRGDAVFLTLDGRNPADGVSDNLAGKFVIRYTVEGKEAEPKDGKLHGIRGNQNIEFELTLKMDGVTSNTVTGVFFVRVPNAGGTKTERVLMGEIHGEQMALEVEYDAAVQYTGKKIQGVNYYGGRLGGSVSENNKLDIAVRFAKLSGNEWIPLDGESYGNYYWKDQTGMTIKRVRLKNNKKAAAYYDPKAPYFTFKVSFSKTGDETLSLEDRQTLSSRLKQAKFYFTIEPVELSEERFTYSKDEADRFYVKKLKMNSEGTKLTSRIYYQNWKVDTSAMNVRKMKKSAPLKAAKMNRKTLLFNVDKNGAVKGDFTWRANEDGTVSLYGVNGYRGQVLHLNMTEEEDGDE